MMLSADTGRAAEEFRAPSQKAQQPRPEHASSVCEGLSGTCSQTYAAVKCRMRFPYSSPCS